MKPVQILLTYPANATLVQIIDHLTTLGKSYGAPHVRIVDNQYTGSAEKDNEEIAFIKAQLTSRGVRFNNELREEDLKLYTYDLDPTEPLVMGSTQGAATIDVQRAQQLDENLVAVTKDETDPPGTPTVGREDRAEKADLDKTPPREAPGFTVDPGDDLANAKDAQAQADADPNDPAK